MSTICLSSLLTLIITTSPTPSAPSTELLSAVIQSFHKHCPVLLQCRIIVVFDTYDRIAPKSQLKRGSVTVDEAHAFELYKVNVKQLVVDEWLQGREAVFAQSTGKAEYGSPHCVENSVSFVVSQTRDRHVTFIEPEPRLGFSLAVRSALRATTTPYVWLHQHDWTLVTDIPVAPILGVMQASEADPAVPVRYVGFPSVRMLSYAIQTDTLRFPALKALTAGLKRDFQAAAHPDSPVPLTPLFFWHDKPHIASTAHYLARVFPSRFAMRRGEFIEDTVGQRARKQMKEGHWHKWACWLYYPGDGKTLCLQHLDGRFWRGAEAEERQKEMWKLHNRAHREGDESGNLDLARQT